MRGVTAASATFMSWSITFRMVCIVVVMMRLPPGLPVARNGLPSLSTKVGDLERRGRLPGPAAWGCAGGEGVGVTTHQAEGVWHAGLGREVIHLIVEHDAGAGGDDAAAEIQIQRISGGDQIAFLVGNGKVRGLIAFMRQRFAGLDV